jgi:carboxymethylenebutenolidase
MRHSCAINLPAFRLQDDMAPTTYDPNSPDEQPVPIPSAPLVTLGPDIVLQPPLSRRGHGPGLIIFLPSIEYQSEVDSRVRKPLDPAPVQKWAEEGFAVIGITGGSDSIVESTLNLAVTTLVNLDEVDIKDKLGVLGMMQSLWTINP